MIPEFVLNPNPDLYRTGSYVVLDFETTNLEKGSALNASNRIILSCWYTVRDGKKMESKYIWGGEYDLQELINDINSVDFIVAQNAKFELQWLHRCGYDVGSRPVYDTMLGEWVIAGNRKWRLNLDAMAKRYNFNAKNKLISLMMKSGVSPEDMPRSMLLKYCIEDVHTTYDIFHEQLREMEGTRLLPIVYTRCLTTLVLADIERNGLHLDKQRVEEEYEKTLKRYIEVERQLEEMTGGINMNSPQQVAKYIYGELGFEEIRDRRSGKPIRNKPSKAFPDGAPKADKNTIAMLSASTAKQTDFLQLRSIQGKLNAALTKNLDFFLAVCREKGGLFRGELVQGRTGTHRLASAGKPVKFKAHDKAKSCQFQNLPRIFKRLFKAREENWYIGEGDGSQLEFRTGGHLGRDSVIQHDIVNHVDVHKVTSDTLTGNGEPTSRQNSKQFTFKPMYGGSKGSPAVEAYCSVFTEKYHEMHAVQKAWAQVAAESGELETEWGMKYYFPDVEVMRSGYIKGQQQVFNYPIQGLATAEIIPIALVHFWYRTRDARLFIINSVHDSIICEIPENEIELFNVEVVKALTTDVYQYLYRCYGMHFSIPLGVGIKLGEHWGQSAFGDEALAEYAPALEDIGDFIKIDGGEISVDVSPPKVLE